MPGRRDPGTTLRVDRALRSIKPPFRLHHLVADGAGAPVVPTAKPGDLVKADTALGTARVNLIAPAGRTGVIIVKKITNNGNTMQIAPLPPAEIDGSTSLIATVVPLAGYIFFSDGVDYWTVSISP